MSQFNSNSTGVNTNYTSTSTTTTNQSYVVNTTTVPTFNYEIEKAKLLADLSSRKGVEVKTSTLFDKYEEVTSTYSPSDLNYLNSLQTLIWQPSDLNNLELTLSEIQSLKPNIIVANDTKQWVHLRRMISTMSYSQSRGRRIKFFVIDEVTGKILGLVEVSSDFGNLGARDKYIGWTKEQRYQGGMLEHTAVGSTIVPVQPFGYNCLGGKLLSMLITSQVVRDEWEKRYGKKLVGITTTSLYGNNGKLTQYDKMKQWVNLGETTGKTLLKPSQELYNTWKSWLRQNYPNEYNKAMKGTGPKQKILQLIYGNIGLRPKQVFHGYMRGAYFSPFYKETLDFLKGLTKKANQVNFNSSVESLVKEWKTRAINRFKELFKNNKVKTSTTFYSDIINQSWDKTLLRYLGIKSNNIVKVKHQSFISYSSISALDRYFKTSFISVAKPTLIQQKTKVNAKTGLNFSTIENTLSCIYFNSFLR